MADISDVENSLRDVVGNILAPGGTPVLSYSTKVYRGYPSSTNLDPALKAGVSHVVVNEANGFSRATPGWLGQEVDTPGVTSITVGVTGTPGNIVTFGGMVNATQLAGIKVNGVAYGYACLSSDTATSVAAALAALSIAGGVTPTISGPALTFPNGTRLVARVGSVGSATLLPRYVCSGVRVSVYAATPAARDAICSLIDAQLSINNRFITLPDGQSARMCFIRSFSDDMPQKEQSWRRDLLYSVEYSTSVTVNAPQMLWGITTIMPLSGTGGNLVSTAVVTDS